METNIQDNIKISVIMPVYNAGEYLSRAIGDVLSGTLPEIQLICVDDGSTDNSPEIIESFKEQDARVCSIHQSNAGPAVARNKGLELAKGKYIIFLDADDMYDSTLLESLYDIAERENLDIAFAKYDIYNVADNKYSMPSAEPHSFIFDGGAVTSKNENPDCILDSTTGYVWNKLFRASFLFDKKLSFDPDLYVFEDVHFVCSVMARAERVGAVDRVLIHHRVYSDQSRATLFRKYYGQVPVVYKKIKEFLMSHGMYIPLKRGYLNFSAGRCYKIYNILWADGKERLWNMLHEQYVAELDWLNCEKSDFENPEVCLFVINTALFNYSEYLEALEKGKSITFSDLAVLEREEFDRLLKQHQRNEQIKANWDKINIFKKPNP